MCGFPRIVVLVSLAGVLAGCEAGQKGPPEPPDPPFVGGAAPGPRGVVLILVDALRADHLGSYGSVRGLTPNLDALARRSHVFENAWATSSWTRASVGSLMTARYPTVLGVLDRADKLEPSALLLSEVLRGWAGFRTFAVSTNGNTNEPFGFAQGYDEFVWTGLRRSYPDGFAIHVAEGVTQEAIGLLDRLSPTDRFFLFVHYVDPHDPYLPHPGLMTEPEPPGRFGGSRRDLVRMDRTPPAELRTEDYERVKYLYAGEVKYCDRWIGALLDELRRPGLDGEVVVVVTADHGEGLWDHGWRGHGRDLYEETIRVPLIVHLPGMDESTASRVASPVSQVDVAPTVLAALGIPPPRTYQGADLLPLTRGASRGRAYDYVYSEMDHGGRSLEAIRHGSLKLIRDRRPAAGAADPVWQLYDLAADPGERSSLWGRMGGGQVNLRAAMREWSLALVAASTESQEIELAELDRETLASLRALGYIGAEEHEQALQGGSEASAAAAPSATSQPVPAGYASRIDFSAGGFAVEQLVDGLHSPAGGDGSVRWIVDRAAVVLKRLRQHSIWDLEFTVELDRETDGSVELHVSGAGRPVSRRIFESGRYSLRGAFAAGAEGVLRLDIECRREPGEVSGADRPCVSVEALELL